MKKTLPIRLLAWFVQARRRRAARRHLEELSDHFLRDIGIERRDIPVVVDGLDRPPRDRAGAAEPLRHVAVFGPRLRGRARS